MCDMKSDVYDPVNRPSHYIKAAVMVQQIELTARLNACLGQAVNYIVRAPYKNNELEDLEKAIFYLKKFDEVRVGDGYDERDIGESAAVLGRIFAKQSSHGYIKEALSWLFKWRWTSELSIKQTIKVLERRIEAIKDPGKALARLNDKTIGPDIEEDEQC